MIEQQGNLWQVDNADARCITTNGDFVGNPIKAVMGKGVAKQAKLRYPGVDSWLALLLEEKGNHVFTLIREIREGGWLLSFPVKHHWHKAADIDLIVRSAHELVHEAEARGWSKVYLPRPGCGNGKLDWPYVKHMIEDILDDRFIIINNEE